MSCGGCRDGRLQERDQILVINGSPLEAGISQQQALSLLQQPGDTVELVVARDRPPNASSQPAAAMSTVRSNAAFQILRILRTFRTWFFSNHLKHDVSLKLVCFHSSC